jgi:hypothetical protein
MTPRKPIPAGTRVILGGGHPMSGEMGVLERWEDLVPGSPTALVRLERDGMLTSVRQTVQQMERVHDASDRRGRRK